ncbi:transcriptional activator of glycolytic enzymes-domain-containing protein [Xylaria curta]|nr:transcriptional activator of glycolytic enzymes-domain-containing protein [Xylaria curta]
MLPQLASTSQVTSSSSIAPPSTSLAAAASTTAPIPIATTTTTATTTAVAATTTPNTAPTSSATPAPGPAARTGASSLKRPAASDLQRIAGTSATPSKKRATGSGNFGLRSVPNPTSTSASASGASASVSPGDPGRIEVPASSHSRLLFQPSPAAAMMPAPAPVPVVPLTEDQLHGRTPEQLIATILQLQTQHQQFVVQINAQYESINQQLNDLRGSLIASHHAAASALTVSQPVRSVVPPPPAPLQQTAVPPPPRPPMQTPTRATPRVPPASPSQHIVPRSAVSTSTPTSAGPPQYEYRTVGTVEEVWREYREGMDGQPAIEKLDATWGSRWRPEPRGRTWYSRRKVIWDKIKEYMAEGMDEDNAVQEVERLRDGGTINKLIRMLQDERKDKGIGEDGMTG